MASAEKKGNEDLNQQIGELTLDLQRTRADFENFRKRVESEKKAAQEIGETKAVVKLLPIIDTIEKAVVNVPAELTDHAWVKGVAGLQKQLDKLLKDLKLEKINSTPGVLFDPELHQAVQFDEDSDGRKEVVAEELRPGYTLNGAVLRDAMVKVVRVH